MFFRGAKDDTRRSLVPSPLDSETWLMSVPIPTISLAWSDTGHLLRESGLADRSELRETPAEVASDTELLRDFVASKPGEATAQAALTRIVERHGAMVYQVALRLVNDRHLADDVFQATFLVLAQSARKIQRSASLASWLHGTARNIGRRALARKFAEQSGTEAGVEMVTAVEDDPFHEMMRSHERQLLDEELQQLPEIHRAPLVLYYLEERSHQAISLLLGVSVSAVESRLKRAKQELRIKLVRRGITLSVAIAAVGFGASVAAAAPPAALITSTVTLAASGAAVGTSLAAGGSVAIQLAGKELAAMSAASKATALFVGAAGTLTLGGAVLFGAMAGGMPGSGDSPGSGEPSGIIATEAGPGGLDEEPQTFLLAQAEEAELPKDDDKAPATEAKEATEKQPTADDDTAYLRQTAQELVGRAPTEAETAAFLQNSDPAKRRKLVARLEKEARIRAEGPFVAKFRLLSDQDREIYESLEMETALEFPDSTLREVMDYISQNHHIPVHLDQQALTDAGLDEETRVNLVISGITLRSSLSLMLENVNGTQLDYYVENGMLFVTTEDKVGDTERLRYYDLSGDSDGAVIENFAQAVEKYALGLDDPRLVNVTSFGDSLAIRTTLGFHKKIEEFIVGALQLAEARRAAGKPLPVVPPAPPAPPVKPMTPMPAAQAVPQGGGSGFFNIPLPSPSR